MSTTPKIYCKFDELVGTDALRPHPNNPNIHARTQPKRLAEVIARNGWREPITVSRLSGYIIKGHGRLLAARAGGFEICPVVYQDYATPADEAADLIADNQLATESELDYDAVMRLADEFDLEADRIGRVEGGGSFNKTRVGGEDDGEDKPRKIPVMILASEEEAAQFDEIKERLGARTDERAFSEILAAYMEAQHD